MKKVILMAILLCAAVSLFAGYVHDPRSGRTFYMQDPTVVTLWRRAWNGVLFPVANPLVYDNSVRELTCTNTVVWSCGVWELDALRHVIPAEVEISMYSNKKVSGGVIDVEWELDSSGHIIPLL